MYLNCVFELSMVLNNEKFNRIFSHPYSSDDYWDENEEEYIDQSLASKGITVVYRDSQYKKKIRLLVDAATVTDGDISNADRFIRKLEKRIAEYFSRKYRLDDFTLSGMRLSTDIDVGSRENVSDYLKVFRRIGKVKGFSPADFEEFDDDISFCLKGNSNAVEFLIYDLEQAIASQLKISGANRNQMKSTAQRYKGILRAEVRLKKPKAIRIYTDEMDASGQIAKLSKSCQKIFFDTFLRVIPYGDYYKKGKAAEILWKEIADSTMRRRMLRLVALIPEKKSLHLAQKEIGSRHIEAVMESFAKINLSPVTISKRHDVKYLKNLYAYLKK